MRNTSLEKIFDKPITHYAALIGIIFIIVFLKIGSFHMRYWDESLFAVNTFEMMENGNYFSLYFDGRPDLFNTKPPLMNWLQILSSKLFGYNELAMRLPSAIAAGLSVIMLFKFTKKHFSLLWAWFSALILLSSFGFIGFHTARTGDSDSLLSFFIFMSTLHFFEYMLTEKRKHILFLFIFITLAFSTKLYASFLFLPAFFLILIYKKKVLSFIVNWHFLVGLLIFLGAVSSLIYIRELQTPGYIHEILFKDAGRLFSIVENHEHASYFYLDNLFAARFSYWVILLIIGISAIIFNKSLQCRTLLIYVLLCLISYFLIITISKTKLVWYDMPLYPLMAIIAAYPLVFIIKNLTRDTANNMTKMKVVSMVALFFFYPLFLMFRQSQDNTIFVGDRVIEANEIYLYEAYRADKNLSDIKVYYHGWKGALLFYKYKFGQIGQDIELATNITSFESGDRILVSKDSLKDVLRDNFHVQVSDRLDNAELFTID